MALCARTTAPISLLLFLLTLLALPFHHSYQLPLLVLDFSDHEAARTHQQSVIPVANASITDVLQQYGLPIGLLPDAVSSFTLSDDGEFVVHLDSTCYAKFDYEVYYDKTVKGKISYGSISDLSGIEAKQFIFWFSVTGIRVDVPSSGYIYFEVGLISKRLSLSLFEKIPNCRRRAMEPRSALAAAN